MTPEQRDQVAAAIAAELVKLKNIAATAGIPPAVFAAELDRRRVTLDARRRRG